MELGALVCTAARPRCSDCPVADRCAWRAAGHPAYDGPPRRTQAWAGTDRQCRGRLMAVLREADGPVPLPRLARAGTDRGQVVRCLESLVADGLAVRECADSYLLPV
jgi:A/G-specific adenine glycosylase